MTHQSHLSALLDRVGLVDADGVYAQSLALDLPQSIWPALRTNHACFRPGESLQGFEQISRDPETGPGHSDSLRQLVRAPRARQCHVWREGLRIENQGAKGTG